MCTKYFTTNSAGARSAFGAGREAAGGGAGDMHEVAGRLRRGETLGDDEALWSDLLMGCRMRPTPEAPLPVGGGGVGGDGGGAGGRGGVGGRGEVQLERESYQKLPPPVKHHQVCVCARARVRA